MNLRLDWATHKAAKYAVLNWHYSGKMPSGKSVKIGVWENGKFIGVVMFGLGAGHATRGERYGLRKTHEVAELTRIALTKHVTPVSKIIAIAIKLFTKRCPGIRLIISFADMMDQGHHGGVYQASNWIYAGTFSGCGGFVIHGKVMHNRSVYSKGWKQMLPWLQANIDCNAKIQKTVKHRYLFPMDEEVRKRVKDFALPYPKRAESSDSAARADQVREDGASPISALQLKKTKKDLDKGI